MQHENRLAREQSPYLLQHRHNPVDWYSWGEEAFQKAAQEDKPIFLSIGYSTCHWCHVMEHESFEDEDVARLMNEVFVSIKVDREERPDIDGIYMAVCQMMTGHGGWPLTIFMTPDRQPFYAGTYLPKESRHGRDGMMEIVPRIGEIWRERRQDVMDSAAEITGVLQQMATARHEAEPLTAETLRAGYEEFLQRFQPYYGGFGTSPKFPTPHNLLFLLRYWKRTGDEKALEMVETTLSQMRRGGIYDHVGFGFHRYSTDTRWLVPHFEKMLYDQALLAMAYTEAFQVTGKPLYAQTAREIFAYVSTVMTSPEGGFFSAEDADSEGREGKFYLWTLDELREVLGPEDAGLAARAFNVEAAGNFEDEATRDRTGENILHTARSLADTAALLGTDEREAEERLDTIRQKLFEHRQHRVRPGKDDKILTDWNGLMIAALAKAAQALNEPQYRAAAERAADFILSALRTENGRLLHRYRDGRAGIQANVDDYAFLTWGLLELYEASFRVDYLEQAVALTDTLLDHFWDEAGGFFFTPDDGEHLIARQKELYDGAVPSGNSIALLNLIRLARITGNPTFDKKADQLGQWAAGQVRRMPSGFSAFLMGLDFVLGPSREIVLVGRPEATDTEALLQAVRSVYLPDKVLLFRPAEHPPEALLRLAPFVESQHGTDGKATLYVCRNYECHRPTTNVAEARALLQA
ncbi:MAG TPA: thioredoxin domain-containing protein [Rhodothermales bacterium]|nr:thioredoxin domain-containing protein [Rhodothermales bacterium]